MNDPFHSSKYSIARAKHHIGDFERHVIEFLNSKPCAHVAEVDPDTSEQVHKYKLTKPMPVMLEGIVSDAANNLRSALDQAVFAVTGRKNTYFPIAPDEPHFENAVKRRLQDLPQEIVDLVRRLKPYKGGNKTLWALNELCNANKHAVIRPVAIRSGGIHFKNTFFSPGPRIMPPVWNREKNEMELFRIRPMTYCDVNLNITTNVAICDIEFVDGKPANAVLHGFAGMVEGIVMAIVAEARRLGLV